MRFIDFCAGIGFRKARPKPQRKLKSNELRFFRFWWKGGLKFGGFLFGDGLLFSRMDRVKKVDSS